MWKIWEAAFTPLTGAVDTGDLQYLEGKSDIATYTITSGTRTSSGVVCAVTPAVGKTFVIGRASYGIYLISGSQTTQLDLRNNGTIVETALLATGSTNPGSSSANGQFCTLGDELVGNAIKTYDINATLSAGTAKFSGTILGFFK